MTQSKLKEHVHYDKNTGIMTWIKPTSNRVKPGDTIGCAIRGEHFVCSIAGQRGLVHRFAWLYEYGEWPKHGIDHINRDPQDNRIENLRDVPQAVNMKNRATKTNKSGCVGVIWYASRNKWMAYIGGRKKRTHLGYFDDKEEAIMARKEAEKEQGYMNPRSAA